jgi:hypothetical protein
LKKKVMTNLTFLLCQRSFDLGRNHTISARQLARKLARKLTKKLARKLARRLARRVAERARRITMRLYSQLAAAGELLRVLVQWYHRRGLECDIS